MAEAGECVRRAASLEEAEKGSCERKSDAEADAESGRCGCAGVEKGEPASPPPPLPPPEAVVVPGEVAVGAVAFEVETDPVVVVSLAGVFGIVDVGVWVS